jgi:anaerobic magnesium-protoporphyrin IX monomethyl ester cyclase
MTVNRKILLVKPGYAHFPLGLAYIARSLIDHEIAFDFIDFNIEPNPNLEYILKKYRYLSVATGGLLADFSFYRKLFNAVKEYSPQTHCVLSGNITSDVNHRILLSTLKVDYLIRGEGELIFPQLLSRLEQGDISPTDLDGLCYQKKDGPSDKQIVQKPRAPRLDLDAKNWMPYWDFFDLNAYNFEFMPVLTGRGCTGRCTFCSPTNGRFRGRPINHILEEIEYLNSNFSFERLAFFTEILFPEEESIFRFCEEYKKLQPVKNWHCMLRLDINPEVLPAMHDAGCISINIGVESGSDEVLRNIKKDISVEQMKTFVNAAKKTKIILSSSFMLANYDETEKDIIRTIDFLIEEKLYGPCALTINYTGTQNYRRALKKGLIPDETKYLESLESLFGKNHHQVISEHLAGNLNYLNLSELRTSELFRVIDREMRRYYTVACEMADIKKQQRENTALVEIDGTCPFCKNPLSLVVDSKDIHPLDLRVECKMCVLNNDNIYVSPFLIESYSRYFEKFKYRLVNAKRIAILGSYHESRRILMYDIFGINYENIIAFIAHKEQPEGFVSIYPIVPISKVKEINPDLIIIIGKIPDDFGLLIAKNPELKSKVFHLSFLSGRAIPQLSQPIKESDLSLLNYSLQHIEEPELFKSFSSIIEKITKKQNNSSLFNTEISEMLYATRFSFFKKPMQTADIDLYNLFPGFGWGISEKDIHGTCWRWLGDNGEGYLALFLISGKDYLLKTLIQTAHGNSQDKFNVYVNNELLPNRKIVLEESRFVYHSCLVPKNIVDAKNGWLLLKFKIDELQSTSSNFPQHSTTKTMALSRVICSPL